jgi:hypothetical protein
MIESENHRQLALQAYGQILILLALPHVGSLALCRVEIAFRHSRRCIHHPGLETFTTWACHACPQIPRRRGQPRRRRGSSQPNPAFAGDQRPGDRHGRAAPMELDPDILRGQRADGLEADRDEAHLRLRERPPAGRCHALFRPPAPN